MAPSRTSKRAATEDAEGAQPAKRIRKLTWKAKEAAAVKTAAIKNRQRAVPKKLKVAAPAITSASSSLLTPIASSNSSTSSPLPPSATRKGQAEEPLNLHPAKPSLPKPAAQVGATGKPLRWATKSKELASLRKAKRRVKWQTANRRLQTVFETEFTLDGVNAIIRAARKKREACEEQNAVGSSQNAATPPSPSSTPPAEVVDTAPKRSPRQINNFLHDVLAATILHRNILDHN
ncbi:hypothetical protein BT63DRAFT_451290 [Microthyrium microscopicum]|uniref:Uncharacterized protein n=1 Tax=Microthyrium microscopicum TaxID=703497 RepID=A0A6A6ULT9_9PEZI|nr:hypothetical protein BT63DRAFT_451290 [Microthyrium microscopicum]